MSRTLSHLGFSIVALAALSGPCLVAQDATTGAVFGTVKNNKGMAIQGARVILDGGRGQMEYATDVSGQFRIVNLIPGRYQFTVSASGYERILKQTISVGLNQRTPVNVVLTPAAAAIVEVVATATAIDTTTQTSGSNFTAETVSSLPLGRSFSAVVNLAPGVSNSGIDNNNPAVSGGSGLENHYVIDGVNTTGAGYGSNGSYSINYGSLGTGINTDFISEVQIKSFGVDAEFGSSTGGVVNAVTKTGDNTFKGQAFAYFDLDSLQSLDKVPPRIDSSQIIPSTFDSQNRSEFGFFVAGPILKDRLFYFVGYNPIRTSVKRTQADPAQGFYGRQTTQKTETNSYYGKLNWTISTSQSLELSIFGDPGKRPYAPQTLAQRTSPETGWQELKFGGSNISLKYNAIFFNDFLVEARLSQNKNKFEVGIDPGVNATWRVTDSINGALVPPSQGGFLYEKELKGQSDQMELKLTKTFGDFEIKTGYLKEDISFDRNQTTSGPSGFLDPHNNQTYTGGVRVSRRYYLKNPAQTTPINFNTDVAPYYRITRGTISAAAISTNSISESMFLQGKYSLNNRLFVKVGARMQQQDMQGVQQSYKFKFGDHIAPRISVTLDPAGDGKNKIYGFFGKYFESIPSDLAVRSLSTEVNTSRSDFYTLNATATGLSDPILDGVGIQDVTLTNGVWVKSGSIDSSHYKGASGFLTPVLPGTKLPYTNEYVLGWDTQPSQRISISNRLIYRSLGRVLEDIGIDGGSSLPYYIGNPGENTDQLAALARQVDPTLAGSGTTATWVKPKRDYWAYEFEIQASGEKWSGFFNARLARLEGNYEGNYRIDNGQSDPNISSMYDFTLEYLTAGEKAAGRGLTGGEMFATGPLPADRALILNGGFTYNWDFGFSAGLLSRFETGTPVNAYYAGIDYDNSGELPSGGRGNLGRTPNTLNFDGTFTYTMKLKGAKSLAFRADVFNLFNVHKVTSVDQDYEASVGVYNNNFMNALTYQSSRRIRLGVKFSF